MKLPVWVGVGFALLCSVFSATAQEQSVPIFDGKSLSGWTVSGADEKDFYVKEGALNVSSPGGWIHTDRKYSDFTLKFEFRFMDEDGSSNSGVFVRGVEGAKLVRGWPGQVYEIELRDMTDRKRIDSPWMGQILRLGKAPEGLSAFDFEAAARSQKKTGEWQECEIRVIGKRITVIMNGEWVSTAYSVDTPDGYIGLEGDHGTTQYRNMQLVEHKSPTSTSDPLDLTGWTVDQQQYSGNFKTAAGALKIEAKGGWIRTAQKYSEYTLSFEYELESVGTESGVYLRSSGTQNDVNGWPADSAKIQLRRLANPRPVSSSPGDARWTGTLVKQGGQSALVWLDSAAAIEAYGAGTGWNSCEIEVGIKEVIVKINGKIVTRANNVPNPAGGYVGFQASGGVTNIRNVRIKGVANALFGQENPKK